MQQLPPSCGVEDQSGAKVSNRHYKFLTDKKVQWHSQNLVVVGGALEGCGMSRGVPYPWGRGLVKGLCPIPPKFMIF